MPDDDLEAVRQLRPYDPTDLAVARTRRRVLTGHQTPASPVRRWLAVAGSAAAIPLLIVAADSPLPSITDDAQVAAERQALQAQGPSLVRPTPAYLATLPTDPSVLLDLLSDQLARDGSNRARPDLLLKNAMDFVKKVEPLLSPEQRSTLLDAIALAPGAEVDHSPRTFHGHDVYLVQQHYGTTVAGFIVDTATGRIISQFAGIGELTDTNNSGLLTYAVVAHPGDRP